MKRTASITIILLFFTMIMGCQTTANRPLNQDQNQTDNMQTGENTQVMVDNFERLAEQVAGVRSASVAISGMNDATNEGTGTINTNPGTNAPGTNTTGNRTNITGTGIGTTPNDQTVNERQPVGTNNPGVVNDTFIDSAAGNNIVVLVGLTLENQSDVADTRNIESSVESKIKNADNRVSRVMVTTDAGIIQEIKDINRSLRDGTSANTVQRNINNLTKRLGTNP